MKHGLKTAIGRWMYPRQTADWVGFVQTNALLGRVSDPLSLKLAKTKIYRPYLSNQFNCADRVRVLQQHYAHTQKLRLAHLIPAAAEKRVLLCDWRCKTDQCAQLFLTAIQDGHREGELCLRLHYQGVDMYACNFVFLEDQGRMCLMVGRLQGSSDPSASSALRQATRNFHGSRPANLMIAAVRFVAHLTECQGVILISNKNRVALNAWRRRKITSNYDQTWTEMGAACRSDGNFELPVLVKSDIDVEGAPSKKRSELRRKQALMEALFADLTARLNQPT